MLTSNRLWRDRLYTFRHYYPHFALVDLAFGLIALFVNPYRTCRKFLQKKGVENIHAYGETPLATYQRIVEQCNIGPHDTWIEMGSGRGKGCFWLARVIGCRVIGIEWVPSFVRLARALCALFRIRNLAFVLADMEKADLKEGTFIYLYGHWPTLQIPPGARVLSVSEPLPGLQVVKSFWVRYPWGRTRAFLQVKL